MGCVHDLASVLLPCQYPIEHHPGNYPLCPWRGQGEGLTLLRNFLYCLRFSIREGFCFSLGNVCVFTVSIRSLAVSLFHLLEYASCSALNKPCVCFVYIL